MKTKLGEVHFKEKAPSISELVEKAKECSELNLEYVTQSKNVYLVRFVESEGWCSKIHIHDNYIDIDDELGSFEGPAVSQMILYTAKELGGEGPKNDPKINFPLTLEGLKAYEEEYLKNRPSMPWAVKQVLLGVSLVLIVLVLVVYFIFR